MIPPETDLTEPQADAPAQRGAPNVPAPVPTRAPRAQTPGQGIGRLNGAVERVNSALPVPSETADARALIDCAVGILVERRRKTVNEARGLLDTLAATNGTGVLQAAAELVAAAAQSDSHDRPDCAGTFDGARLSDEQAQEGRRAARALLDNALQPLGAHGVALWALAADGALHLVGHAGFPAGVLPGHQAHGGDGPTVLTVAQQAARSAELVWSADADQGPLPSGEPCHRGARAAAPACHNGQVVGALEICFDRPLAPDTRLARQLDSLADLAAHIITDTTSASGVPAASLDVTVSRLADSLPDPVMLLTPAFEARGRLSDFTIAYTNDRFRDLAGRPATLVTGRPLRQVYPAFARPGGLWEKIENVFATGEPYRSDDFPLFTEVGTVGVNSRAQLGVSRVNDTTVVTWRLLDENAQRLAILLQHAQRLGRIGGFEDDLASGRTTWNEELYDLFGRSPGRPPVPLVELRERVHEDDRAAFDAFRAAVTAYRKPSAVSLRIRRTDHVIRHVRITAEPVLDHAGELVAIRGACQDVSAHHWTEVALDATRDQLAQTRAHVSEQARLTRQLQHAIMPATPQTTHVRGLDIAVRYRPASQDQAVGGDWYDTVELPNGTVLIAVGDVAGHGIGAATGMVALRNALRGLATTGAGPAQLLSWLNNVAFHLTDNVTATAICGIFDPATRTLRWARAGHPPPLLLDHGTPRGIPAGPGLLLGALPDAGYEERRLPLDQGQTLLLFTDGLIERKDDSSGQDDLQATLCAPSFPRDRSLPEQLDHLLAHSQSDTDDDTCLIAVHLPLGPADAGGA